MRLTTLIFTDYNQFTRKIATWVFKFDYGEGLLDPLDYSWNNFKPYKIFVKTDFWTLIM
jgi:hypothetical protein